MGDFFLWNIKKKFLKKKELTPRDPIGDSSDAQGNPSRGEIQTSGFAGLLVKSSTKITITLEENPSP